LGRFAKEVSAPADPSIRQLKTIQHLWSSVRAKNIHHRLIPQMIDELFPTPATCGNPKLEAMRIIENIEEHTRGLYAGVIGWYGYDDYAEFFVPLRCGLYRNHQAHIFTGCGIMQDSDDEREYIESEMKAKSILALIGNEG
jgi:menaquinone-specific isochorismate synthase